MKYFPFLLLSLFLIQCSSGKLSPTNQSYNKDDYLFWSDTRKLSWNDFQGTPQGSPNDYSSQVSISIPSSIHKEAFTAPTLTSVCVFDKRNSWVHMKVANDTLLLYNQTLFDIYELYARKLRKTFLGTEFGIDDFREKYQDMTTKNNADLSNRLEEFRRVSFHGQKSKPVFNWAAQIKKELQDLNQFKVDY